MKPMAPQGNKRNCFFQLETWLHLATICMALLFKLLNIQVIVFSIMRVIMLIIEMCLERAFADFCASERKPLFHSWGEGNFILKE